MAFQDQINKHMHVKNSAGDTIGVVDAVDGDRIKLTAKDSTDGQHHYVPISDVTRVDEHVHLSTAGLAPYGHTAGTAAATTHKDAGGIGKILPWLLLGLGLLVALLWLAGSFDGRDDGAEGITDTGAFSGESEAVDAGADTGAMATGTAAGTAAGVGTLGTYLAGTEAAPRTFAFETLNFDTGKSEVRDADKAELASVATALKATTTSRVRVVGYADANGAEPANAQLGKARADAVKAALVASGIDAGRIETASGGEDAPVDSNATAGGRAENRRTELVVVSR